jgi:hypothetical protein
MMTDANIRIPAEARDRLAEVAAAGMSLRAYLARLADVVLTPAERVVRAARAREVPHAWNGHDPSPEDEARLDAAMAGQVVRVIDVNSP